MLKDIRVTEAKAALFAGALTAVLYGTVILMPVFLLPIGHVGARRGFRAMFLSSLAAITLISVWQFVLIAKTGPLSNSMLFISFAPPVILVVGMLVLAAPGLSRIAYPLRVLLVTAVATMISLPSMLIALKDEGTKKIFENALMLYNEKLGGNSVATIWDAMIIGISSTYGSILFAFLFISSWLAYRLGKISLARKPIDVKETGLSVNSVPYIASYKVPDYLVWPLLASWAALLANRFFPSRLLSAVALNAALSLSICYGVQGLAVVRALADRFGLASALRFAGPIIIMLLVLNTKLAMILFGILALLGTLETWIPFRAATKGDLP